MRPTSPGSGLTGPHDSISLTMRLIQVGGSFALAPRCGGRSEGTLSMRNRSLSWSFLAAAVSALAVSACSTTPSPQVAASAPPEPEMPARVRPTEIVGRWGYAAYHKPEDRARIEQASCAAQATHVVCRRGARDAVMTRRLVAIPMAPWERDGIKAALVKAKLPADDLGDARVLVWRFETIEGTPVGFGGLEIFGRDALLRSLVTLPPLRQVGMGAAMVAMLETEARALKCHAIYLLTT